MRAKVAHARLPARGPAAERSDDAAGAPRADAAIDARNRNCPIPALLLRKHFRQAFKGQVVCISVTDPGAPEEIRRFCRNTGDTPLTRRDMRTHVDLFVRKSRIS